MTERERWGGESRRRVAAALLALLLAALAGLAWAQPARAEYRGFADVSPTAWYVAGGWLDWAVDSGVMTGTKDPATQLPSGRFEPEGGVTRGQVATILYRMANPGSTATTVPSDYGASTSFTDVRTRYYYTAAIEWCYERGVVTGYRDPATQAATGRFGPEDPVTREQLATMLYRFATLVLGRDGSGSDAWASLPDAPSVQPFAREALSWCYAQGVMTGSVEPSGTFLRPREGATRAQAAKMAGAVMADGPAPDPADQEAWAVLYADGTLVFQRGGEPDPARGEVVERWTGFEEERYDYVPNPAGGLAKPNTPWCGRLAEVTAVVVEDAISPVSTRVWFADMYNCASFDLALLDTSKVTDMSFMFATEYERVPYSVSGLSDWDVSSVVDMGCMFAPGPSGFLDLSGWDVSSVGDMFGMFEFSRFLTALDVSGWDTSRVTDMHDMFWGCSSLASLDVSGWNTSWVRDMRNMFAGCESLSSLDLSGWDVSRVTDMGLPYQTTGMGGMFQDCTSLTSLNLTGWDVSSVTDTSWMFSGCSSLISLDLSGWNTSRLESAGYMFKDCASLVSLNLFNWDTSAIRYKIGMFDDCPSLSQISLGAGFTLASELPGPLWYAPDGTAYAPSEIPTGVAATYTTTPPAGAAAVSDELAAEDAALGEPPSEDGAADSEDLPSSVLGAASPEDGTTDDLPAEELDEPVEPEAEGPSSPDAPSAPQLPAEDEGGSVDLDNPGNEGVTPDDDVTDEMPAPGDGGAPVIPSGELLDASEAPGASEEDVAPVIPEDTGEMAPDVSEVAQGEADIEPSSLESTDLDSLSLAA